MIIDAFTHHLPVKYRDELRKELAASGRKYDTGRFMDTKSRLEIMDRFKGLTIIPGVNQPPLEDRICSPERATELARIANDELAALVREYPDRFPTAVACLPLNNMKDTLAETDRAIKKLNFKGVMLYTPINDKALDSPEFLPLYAKMEEYDLPIWLHPHRPKDYPDYRSEQKDKTEDSSKYNIATMVGLISETTTAMARLVMSGIIEQFPRLKFIVHYCGGMVPAMYPRLARLPGSEKLKKPPLDYYKSFYVDTNLYGSTSGLMCGYDFFGADHMLFGTDQPSEERMVVSIASVEHMTISRAEKEMIFAGNARRLLHLD